MSFAKAGNGFSLTPGFSPVGRQQKRETVSTVSPADKPLKRLPSALTTNTRLKPGANEKSKRIFAKFNRKKKYEHQTTRVS
jgi:hypothetical protein